MKFFSIILLLVTLMTADEKYEHEEHYFPLDMSYLKLSNIQHIKVKKLVENFRHEYKKFHIQEKNTDKKIAKLFLEKEFNIDRFIQLSSQLQKDAIQIQADFLIKMHKILTPTQKRRFIKYMREWEVE